MFDGREEPLLHLGMASFPLLLIAAARGLEARPARGVAQTITQSGEEFARCAAQTSRSAATLRGTARARGECLGVAREFLDLP